MSEGPAVYTPEADVPLAPIEGETDERVLTVAAQAAQLQEVIRQVIPYGPQMELALRYADLAVQAAAQAAQDSPPVAPGGGENEAAAHAPS